MKTTRTKTMAFPKRSGKRSEENSKTGLTRYRRSLTISLLTKRALPQCPAK